ncbi:MAG: glycine cleavage system aminomethyltransferase GcvT [Candidatus Bathyarchaeota archaeon]|nr:MAG: glycine cleavage system aminomethyltransferase GcvT [Candidatus Bathyarchaeota archaeon]
MRELFIHEFHKTHGNLTEFAGFQIPLWYEGVIPEHMAVRENVGLFDTSHMGRAIIAGKNSAEFLDYVTSRDPSNLNPFQGQYSTICNIKGGIIDDLTVYNLEDNYLIVYNAANRIKDFKWLVSHAADFDVEVKDVSDETCMFALQGPKADFTLQKLVNNELHKIRRYWVEWLEIGGLKALVMKSGYTGENGFEIIVFNVTIANPKDALKLWHSLLKAGKESQIKPCGLGARDSLRLEAGMCLYGNELTEEITPFEAKIDFVVKLSKEDFIGRSALAKQNERGVTKIRIGLKMVDPGIPRQGYAIISGKKKVGFVTSGGFSPLLKCGIAMGYVPPNLSHEGTCLNIEVRKKKLEAEVIKMPFYNVDSYGWKRKLVDSS